MTRRALASSLPADCAGGRGKPGGPYWCEWGVACAILLLALGLRFYRLDAQSLWNDEGTSVALAQRDLLTSLEVNRRAFDASSAIINSD